MVLQQSRIIKTVSNRYEYILVILHILYFIKNIFVFRIANKKQCHLRWLTLPEAVDSKERSTGIEGTSANSSIPRRSSVSVMMFYDLLVCNKLRIFLRHFKLLSSFKESRFSESLR